MSKKRFVNFFHCEADNVGDRMCGPAQYFWPSLCQDVPIGAALLEPVSTAVIGGGQVFSQLGTTLASVLELNPTARAIAWGVGLPPKGTRDRIVGRVSKAFAAFGTRNYDWREQFPFVPCASCMSPLFDQTAPPQHEFVVYLHRKKAGPLDVPEGVPTLTNAMRSPKEVVDFIASGRTIVTSSYHGVYWAQLLGRRVICIPYNNKFSTFQHPPTMAEPDKWLEALGTCSLSEPLLTEYRALNHAFARRALEILNE